MRWSSKSGSVHKILRLLDVFLEPLAGYAKTSEQTNYSLDKIANCDVVASCEHKLPSKFHKSSAIKSNDDLTELNCRFMES